MGAPSPPPEHCCIIYGNPHAGNEAVSLYRAPPALGNYEWWQLEEKPPNQPYIILNSTRGKSSWPPPPRCPTPVSVYIYSTYIGGRTDEVRSAPDPPDLRVVLMHLAAKSPFKGQDWRLRYEPVNLRRERRSRIRSHPWELKSSRRFQS